MINIINIISILPNHLEMDYVTQQISHLIVRENVSKRYHQHKRNDSESFALSIVINLSKR